MIFEASRFIFRAPPVISRARRVLIKPAASYPVPYPVSTSVEMLSTIIEGVRAISDADILILESMPTGEPVYPVYQALGYKFPRILMLDVKDCISVEVENPLPKPFIVPTFWIPNVILSSDYLISVAPLKVQDNRCNLSIMNLLTLLPPAKYHGEGGTGWQDLWNLGIDKVLADLYYTLPFDLGIIEARQKFIAGDDPTKGKVEDCGLVFVGEPYEVDCEASAILGLEGEYLKLITEAKKMFDM